MSDLLPKPAEISQANEGILSTLVEAAVDALLMVSIVVSFATFVTAHAALIYGLFSRRPTWQAVLAVPLFPLAAYYGYRERLRVRTALWVAAALAYVGARVAGAILSP